MKREISFHRKLSSVSVYRVNFESNNLDFKEELTQKLLHALDPEDFDFLLNRKVSPLINKDSQSKLTNELGWPTSDQGAPYATDAGNLQELDFDCYIFGPGELNQAHRPNESLKVKSFFEGIKRVEKNDNSILLLS